MKRKVLIVLSGGQDSTTCLYLYRAMGYELHAVTFDYGQRHSREVECAERIAAMAGVHPEDHEVIAVPKCLKGTSPLVSGNELEQYPDGELPGGIEKTFVPMRNQLFLTIAANRAAVLGIDTVVTGVCEEDYGGYPDCRQVYIDAIQEATRLASFTGEDGLGGTFRIDTPLMRLTKAETCWLAWSLPGCYKALAYSHTGYDGAFPPTGQDHATLLRAQGFEEAGLPDPMVLNAVSLDLMAMPDTPNYDRDLVRQAWDKMEVAE